MLYVKAMEASIVVVCMVQAGFVSAVCMQLLFSRAPPATFPLLSLPILVVMEAIEELRAILMHP